MSALQTLPSQLGSVQLSGFSAFSGVTLKASY